MVEGFPIQEMTEELCRTSQDRDGRVGSRKTPEERQGKKRDR